MSVVPESAMRAIENTTDRLILAGASPLFRPFFLGGLGILVLGAGLVFGDALFGRSPGGSVDAGESPVSTAGMGVFLAAFGFFLAITPLAGRFPFRKEIIVDRAAGEFIRRDRTLVRLRQVTYPMGGVHSVDLEEARHVDGDPYFTLVLRLESGDAVTLERFTDRSDAALTAGLIRDHLGPPESAAEPARPGPSGA
jgi:hypothetical protein